ncbi:MAG: undecaprenyldiphospho-muramoylpentapeptide beta-N-acetylglucosaminyltransferase [Aerococcus urinaeequi]
MRILLSGGGTGGHIYPALALRKQILAQYPDAEFLYVGTEGGLESKIVPNEGVNFKTIQIQGIKRSLSLDNARTVYYMFDSIRKAKQIVRDFNPDVAIGTGGYVCAPVLFAAARTGVPSIIHEQNSVAGMTNKFLAPFMARIAICFEDVAKDFKRYANKVVFTGNPRAQEVASITDKADLTANGLENGKPTVLIFGGSRGALRINETVKEAIPSFIEKDYQVLIASGDTYYEEFKEAFADFNEWDNVQIVSYIDNMPALFNTIDLVVCRSGATTMTELTALGTPSILIPSPNVTANHQEMNARSLVKHDGARMILENDLNVNGLLDEIDGLMADKNERARIAANALNQGVPDAGDRLIKIIESLVK